MAFTPNRHLTPDPTVILRDQRHAARVFTDDQFRLAPKQKFLFHVAFGINTAALSNTNIVQRYGNEINMMVKSVDLPSFAVQTETLNQYNRKKVVQYQHKPQEVNVKFHDDNMGLINQVWQNYYSYYYADSTSAKTPGAYNRNATRSSDFILTPYGLDNGSSMPFFNYIKVYQMARHEFVCYEFHNPIISMWNHNKLEYAGTGTHDFDMKLQYEAVSYSVGAVTPGNPEGFALEHYDSTPSPLVGANPDPTNKNPSFVQSLNIEGAAPSILDSVITQVNTAQNTKQPTGLNGTPGVVFGSVAQTLNGLQGITFPIAAVTNNATTLAKTTNLGI